MLFTSSLFVTFIILTIIVVIKHVRKRSRHPPGPLGLPFIGLLPFQIIQLTFSNYLPKVSQVRMFRQMRERYGDYWSMEMGGQRIVTLASLDALNEGFVNNAMLFSGRPKNEVYQKMTDGQGIVLIDGKLWKDNRQMAIKALRDLGMGKRDLEIHIIDEGNKLIDCLMTSSSKPIDSSVSFIKAVSNVISRLVFNEFNKYGDPEFEGFVKDLKIALISEVVDTKCSLLPKFFSTELARYMFSDVDEYFRAWESIKTFIDKKFEKRKIIQNDAEEPSCVFDHFWRHRYQDEPEIKDDRKIKEIFFCMSDLYMAGSETTNTFLNFCCLMLGGYEDAQDIIRTELQTLTDDYKHINMSMKKDCPKLLSFIAEVERYCCLVPKFPRRVMQKCMFRGYELYPEDIIIGDFGTIARDKTLFKNPDVFDPFRFMDESRTKYVPSEHMVTFGLAKRTCPGEGIATMEIFLFLSRIILTFKISLPRETFDNLDDIVDGKAGFVHAPLDHRICLSPL